MNINRNMSLKMGFLICLVINFPIIAQNIDTKRSTERLNSQIQTIEKQRKLMTDNFYYSAAVDTLKKAFQENGISYSKTFADSWGKMGIGLTWSESAKPFYDYHLQALNDSLSLIKSRGYSTKKELDYLDQGMQIWKQYDQNLNQQFMDLVGLFTVSAKINDEKEAQNKQFDAKFKELSERRPYPSNEIDNVKQMRNAVFKALDEREKEVNNKIELRKQKIKETSQKHVFSAITKNSQSIPPIDTTPPEVLPINNTNPKPTSESSDDEGLEPPAVPDVIRQKCKAKNPNGVNEAEAEEKTGAEIQNRANQTRQQAEKTKSQAEENRKLAQKFAEDAQKAKQKGDSVLFNKDKNEEAKYNGFAINLENESKNSLKAVDELEKQAKMHRENARKLWVKILETCGN
ncbi:MAG: hypothetical protein K1X72_01215 [Pyrinomonadaceae bacterium]|nr:hypothetical protein [Pyrinomonadaceae bacterium]